MEGVFVGYSNYKRTEQKGSWYRNIPRMRVPFEFDAIVFTPHIGDFIGSFYPLITFFVVGKVTKVGIKHISLLVFGVFNAYIYDNKLPPSFHKPEPQYWENKDNSDEKITVNSLIKFEIAEYFDF